LIQIFKNRTSGFTLIELLVVIGILSVLATSLIMTINPFEQIKKSEDANVKNQMVEFDSSIVRYFSTRNQLPWMSMWIAKAKLEMEIL